VAGPQAYSLAGKFEIQSGFSNAESFKLGKNLYDGFMKSVSSTQSVFLLAALG
jgi:hypothetical protein